MGVKEGGRRAPRELDARAPTSLEVTYFLSRMAALTLAAMSGGIAVILCTVFACSAPLAITSASSLPSMTALQPGIKSPHLSTFAIVGLLHVPPHRDRA